MKRPPLKIGDRVRVKDIDQTDGRACSDTGNVIGVSSDAVLVKLKYWSNKINPEGEEGMWFFPRQCRRLKSKPRKPTPKKERDVPLRMMAWLMSCDGFNQWFYTPEAAQKRAVEMSGPATIHEFAQLHPGEIPMSRDALKLAFAEALSYRDEEQVEGSGVFLEIAKALGFADKGEA